MAYRDELVEKLKERRPDVAQDDTVKEIEKTLQQVYQSKGANLGEARKHAQRALELIQKHASDLEQRKTYRNAALQYYTGYQLIHEFFDDATQEKNWLLKTAQMLDLAAEHYLQWGEIDEAVASKIIGVLIRMLTGDWNVTTHLDSFRTKVDFNNPKAQAARGIIYIPYDIVQAMQTLDPQYMHRAESYLQGYLKAVQSSQHFFAIIDSAMNFAKQEFMKRVKLPRLVTHVKYSQDIVFGEEFDFSFSVRNNGEGVAKDVVLSLSLPSQLNLVQGDHKKSVPVLNPGDEATLTVKLICPTGEGQSRVNLNVTAEIQYRDILDNTRTSLHGPHEVVIRATKKSDELLATLEKIQASQQELLEKFNIDAPSDHVKKLRFGLTAFHDSLVTAVKQHITEEEFDAAEALMNILKELYANVFQPTAAFFNDYVHLMQDTIKFIEETNQRSQQLQEKLQSLSEAARNATTPKIH